MSGPDDKAPDLLHGYGDLAPFNEDSGRFPVLIDFEKEDAARKATVSTQPSSEDIERFKRQRLAAMNVWARDVQDRAVLDMLRDYSTDLPLYEHDCEVCVYLGRYKTADLYCHTVQPGAWGHFTVIARYSAEVGDYLSGLAFAENDAALREAKRRAIARGLLK